MNTEHVGSISKGQNEAQPFQMGHGFETINIIPLSEELYKFMYSAGM